MAQTNSVDGQLMTKDLTDVRRTTVETRHLTTNVSSEYEQQGVDILVLLQMSSTSVLDGDVFEAAQEVVIVQAVQVLTHLTLQIQTS